MLIESGSLVCKDGTWCLLTKELSIPTKVKDVILYRLNRLTAIQRRMLDLGSVIEKDLTLHYLGRFSLKIG